MLKRLTTIALVFCSTGIVFAGDLEPPGPPGATMKTLNAVEPRTPIHTLGSSATGLYVITQPGSYYLAQNIYGVNAKNGIEITVNNVTIDLMGFSLIGVAGSLDGIMGTGLSDAVTVRNGTVKEWGGSGVNLPFTYDFRADDLVVSDCGWVGLSCGGGIIENSQFLGNEYGIFIDSGSLINCRAIGNTEIGVSVASANGSIRNVVSSYNGFGFSQGAGGGWVIESSSFNSNDTGGISVCGSNIIRNNTVRYNNADTQNAVGIYLRCGGNLVDGNLVYGNDIGIKALSNGGEVVIRNSLANNTTAIDASTGNDFAPLQKAGASTNPWANISN